MHRLAVALFLAGGLGIVAGFAARGEEIVFYAPHAGPPVTLDPANPGQFGKIPGPPHAIATGGAAKSGNLTFNLTFADVTGNTNVGFDDPALGATRRATAQTVANYLNLVLNGNSGAVLDIDFQVSQTDGTGFLASAGTYWFTAPNQYNSGFAWTHTITGVDPYDTVPDIQCTVDFGYTWNDDFGAPAGGEYDLPSVLLHEFTHGLGFAALSTATGTSSISGGNPGVFTLLTDGLLRGTGSVDLWNAAYTFTGSSADLISNDVYFTGPNATAANGGSNPRIYAPGTFAPGSSLSHWNTATYPTAVMRHATASGVQTRQYSAIDIGALRDLGYGGASDTGQPVPVSISGFATE